MPSDLTFSDAQIASGVSGTFTYDAGNDDVLISVKKITGDSYAALTDTGVIEFVSKLLNLCEKAQTSVNATAVAGSRLNAFQSPVYGVPSQEANGDFYASVTYTMIARAPLSLNDPIGPVI
ncbi:hypothetical protein BST81_13735 [Leptolyngbya sp. 'hensonii']|uniref:hypothetical protein n=1 Tax=Leptolyngbya sp. 'hensonii' TaxID=1922337 RepID=UPI00094F5787|nr:hypothetical protein [Leptolyngbya sp. 'hensonii']OLP18081.1 hypothetical protein BST81_13735 [Leptolyngbya sp. 'hensonii']